MDETKRIKTRKKKGKKQKKKKKKETTFILSVEANRKNCYCVNEPRQIIRTSRWTTVNATEKFDRLRAVRKFYSKIVMFALQMGLLRYSNTMGRLCPRPCGNRWCVYFEIERAGHVLYACVYPCVFVCVDGCTYCSERSQEISSFPLYDCTQVLTCENLERKLEKFAIALSLLYLCFLASYSLNEILSLLRKINV